MRLPRIVIILVSLTLPGIGCGSGSSSAGSLGQISGNWQMSLPKTGSKLAPNTVSGFLEQGTGTSITGNVMVTNVPCSGTSLVTGTINQSNISMNLNPSGTTLSLTGTIGSTSATMSGTYVLLSTGCRGSASNPSQSGNWTASLVHPLQGNVTGTFVSSTLGSFDISGQVSQGQSNGSSNAPLTGTLSITGSSCFSSATISGVISGTAVAINLADSVGTEIGQITGTSSLDGTSLTGSYKIVPKNGPSGTPCLQGDSGTVTFTL